MTTHLRDHDRIRIERSEIGSDWWGNRSLVRVDPSHTSNPHSMYCARLLTRVSGRCSLPKWRNTYKHVDRLITICSCYFCKTTMEPSEIHSFYDDNSSSMCFLLWLKFQFSNSIVVRSDRPSRIGADLRRRLLLRETTCDSPWGNPLASQCEKLHERIDLLRSGYMF